MFKYIIGTGFNINKTISKNIFSKTSTSENNSISLICILNWTKKYWEKEEKKKRERTIITLTLVLPKNYSKSFQ